MKAWWIGLAGLVVVAAACSDDGGASRDEGEKAGRGAVGGAAPGGTGQGGAASGGTGQGGSAPGGATGGALSTGGSHSTGGGPTCALGQTDGVALAVAELSGEELGAEALAYFEHNERFSGFFARRDDGWLVGGYDGFWEVTDSGARVRVDALGNGDVRGFVTGDLEADGREDVISVHETTRSGTAVTVLAIWQRGADGSLLRRGAIEPFANASANDTPVGVADVDQDGDLDLVTFDAGAPVVHRHDGDFGFERIAAGPRLPLESVNARLLGLWTYDADGDRTTDLVGAFHRSDGTERIEAAVFPGDGAGRFSDAVLSELGAWYPNLAVGNRDVTGDAIPDLAIFGAGGGEGGELVLAAGAADGTFEAYEPRTVMHWGIGFADADGDGIADVVGWSPDGVHVELARGDNLFETRFHRVAPGSVRAVAPVESSTSEPGRVGIMVALGCHTSCEPSCAGQCFAGQCLECTASVQCGDALCVRGSCETCALPCGDGGAGGLAGAGGGE